MSTYVALLRAVNVGGTGKIAMSDLRRICEQSGGTRVETYIASGNLIFESRCAESTMKNRLGSALAAHAGQAVGVLLRTAEELAAVRANNPFPGAPPNRTMVLFLDVAPVEADLASVSGRTDEQLRLGTREIYILYGPAGMGNSKLRIPAARQGTARNMNTVAKLADLAAAR
jgi:uncharacterized protein (DUF1697 family)